MNTGPHAQAALERTGSGTYDDDDFEALSPSDQTHVTNSTSGPVHFVMTIEEPAAPPPPRRRGSATGAVGSNPLPPPPSRGEEGTSHLSPSQPQPAQPPTTRLRKLPRRMQSDPQLPTAHAVANRTLGERWIQKRYDAHRAAVVGARASVDNECPGSFRCLVSSGAPSVAASEESNEGDGDQETWNRQGKKKRPGSSSSRRSTSAGATVGSGSIINLKKRQMERDRQAQINARNQALLQKCQVVADVTAREYAREPAASHMRGALEHRARVRRVKQLGSIEVENRTLLRRIEAKSSPYSVVAMAADRAQNLRYLVNIAAHKSKYVDEMHAMRILDAEIDAAAATAAKLAAVPPTVMDPPRVPSATPSRPARVQSAPVGRTSSPTVPAGATSDPLSSPSPKKRPGIPFHQDQATTKVCNVKDVEGRCADGQ
ncbi:hypothetical protein BC828DRAFT_400179 [Blastocladiella britannica]|nr:hypothetical protein BC828DRAFT_400179 [Blastocladiella britannica]